MLAAADTNLERFFPIFASTGVKVAFLSPTPTGYEKSIMDAIGDVRVLLKESGIHDYETQKQGPENKVVIESYFVLKNRLMETSASLYRPVTKKGDPRIWFANLRRYCQPHNLLALIVSDGRIYVINLSDTEIASSLLRYEFVYQIVKQSVHEADKVSRELLSKILQIHKQGFLPSITPGDPGVGDTLENALGISRNNIAAPDYKGIELKATRLTRGGTARTTTRVNLFSKVPEEGMSYADIVRAYGKWTYNKQKKENRLSLENTTYASHPNSHGLMLAVDGNNDRLFLCHMDENIDPAILRRLSFWHITSLRQQLLTKHRETFWVQAQSETRNGIEWFRYDKIVHTKNPNDSLFASLVESDKIMVDLVAHISENTPNKCRDHGMLFKMWPADLPLLFGNPMIYDLVSMAKVGI